jgi:glyoxylase-like metal-dependent hydrolase (beta-lactamase superfamily II)
VKSKDLQSFYDDATATLTYVAWDTLTLDAVIFDSVLDYDPATKAVGRNSIDRLVHFVNQKKLRVHWVFDTHAHADHLSAAGELCELWPQCRWALGDRMTEVFSNFKKVFAWPADVKLDHLGVSRWLKDGEEVAAGVLRVQAHSTPGHTPACMTYQIGDWLFTGDALMMPDSGVGRCDFPGGSASELYESIWKKMYSWPDHFQVFVGHDYKPGGRPVAFQSSLGEQKERNIHLKTTTPKAEFVKFREGRDKTLQAPRLLEPSLDWNLGAHQVVPRD